MRARYLWPLVLGVLLIFALIKGGIYQTDFRYRHKHIEAPATVESPQKITVALSKKSSSNEDPTAPITPEPQAPLRPISQMTQKEAKSAIEDYEKRFKKDFNPFEKLKSRVVGIVNFSYNGYQINFRMIIKKPELWEGEVQNYPIRFENLVTSKMGVSTAASLQSMMSTDKKNIVFHLYTPMIMSVLETKNEEMTNQQMRKILGDLSDIMVAVDLNSNSTPIFVRQHLDSNESPIQVGEFTYTLKN